MKKILLFIFITLASLSGFAQAPAELLKPFMEEVRSGKSVTVPDALLQTSNAKSVVDALLPYTKDTLVAVRSRAYFILQRTALASQEAVLKAEALQHLIEGGKDKDSGLVGQVFSGLSQFSKNDFNGQAKDSLQSLFKLRPTNLDKLIRLIGFLNISALQNELMVMSQPGNSKRDRWAALIALSRMGEPSALALTLDRVKKLPVNDDVVYEVFPDLIYTRQKEAFNYMIAALQDDDKKCESADPENAVAIPCGYRIMEHVAPVIQDFPLAVDASGDIKTKDYKKALTTARNWFKEKGAAYEIDTTGY
jgi:hypothetical protein